MRGAVAAVAYLAIMTALVYGVFDRGDSGLWVFPVLVALQLGLGFASAAGGRSSSPCSSS
jgi:hypothetical protein